MAAQSLAALRRRLTTWYVATFAVILGLLGGGLFLVLRAQFARQLDDSLRDATREIVRAAHIREMEAERASGPVVDALDELRIPDRTLLLLDTLGRAVKPATIDSWIAEAARDAASVPGGRLEREHEAPGRPTLRLHAERFLLASGASLVAVAVADQVELEDRYAALIAAFGGAALVAVVLVAAGGSVLVRTSTAPVERGMEQMRRFMADAAHELRTPIAVLRSRADVALQRPRPGDEYVGALRAIEDEARRLGGIVDNLLTLARADAGERPLDRRRLFLDDIVLDAADAAHAIAEPKGVRLEVAEYEEAALDGDAVLLRQLVMILLDNAVKFTPAGGAVRVRVTTHGTAPLLVVEDTGVGIPRAQQPHVFDRFYRGDPSRARADGAGLGLAIARWIADAHGAEIALASEPGNGTQVTVRFAAPAAA